MKHIVMFSGGVQSAYVAYLVAQKESKKDIILLFSDTKSEDCDNARFRKEVADYLKLKLIEVADGRTTWDLISRKKFFPSVHCRYCTQTLKIKPRNHFLQGIPPRNYTVYLGFGREEWRRIQKSVITHEGLGVTVKFPLADIEISKEKIFEKIENDWGIKTPHCYKVLEHANCIPCFLGGKKHFFFIWKYYPTIYSKAKNLEKEFGKHILEKCLFEYEEQFKEWEKNPYLIPKNGYIPCDCFAE